MRKRKGYRKDEDWKPRDRDANERQKIGHKFLFFAAAERRDLGWHQLKKYIKRKKKKPRGERSFPIPISNSRTSAQSLQVNTIQCTLDRGNSWKRCWVCDKLVIFVHSTVRGNRLYKCSFMVLKRFFYKIIDITFEYTIGLGINKSLDWILNSCV